MERQTIEHLGLICNPNLCVSGAHSGPITGHVFNLFCFIKGYHTSHSISEIKYCCYDIIHTRNTELQEYMKQTRSSSPHVLGSVYDIQ